MSLEPGWKVAHPSLTETAAGLAPLLAQRGGRAGTAEARRGQGAGREGRQQLCTRVWVSTCAGQGPQHTCLTHQLSSASPCPGTALPIPALQEHPHGRLGVLISELFSLPPPPLSVSLSSSQASVVSVLAR